MTHSTNSMQPPSEITLKNGQQAYIRRLTVSDADNSDLLIRAVLRDLEQKYPEGQTFLHPKTSDQIREILRTNAVFGAFIDEEAPITKEKKERLIAQCAVRMSSDPSIPLLPDMANIPANEIFTVHFDMTHPNYRRQKLSQSLLSHIFSFANEQ